MRLEIRESQRHERSSALQTTRRPAAGHRPDHGGRVAVITGSRIVPLKRPASVLSGNADAGTW